MKKNWQLKVLLSFLIIFILFNLETFLLKTVEFIVRIPLNIHSVMSNTFGEDFWGKIVIISGKPSVLITVCLISIILSVGTIRLININKK